MCRLSSVVDKNCYVLSNILSFKENTFSFNPGLQFPPVNSNLSAQSVLLYYHFTLKVVETQLNRNRCLTAVAFCSIIAYKFTRTLWHPDLRMLKSVFP